MYHLPLMGGLLLTTALSLPSPGKYVIVCHCAWPGPPPISEGAPTASASGSMYSKCITDAGDGGRLQVGQRASRTWTSPLSAKDPQMTLGSTQSRSPAIAHFPHGVEFVRGVPEPSDIDKSHNAIQENKSRLEEQPTPPSSSQAHDVVTNEELVANDGLTIEEQADEKALKPSDPVAENLSSPEKQSAVELNGSEKQAGVDVITWEGQSAQHAVTPKRQPADHALTPEEEAILHAVPVGDDMQVGFYSLPRVFIADFSEWRSLMFTDSTLSFLLALEQG